MTPIKTIRINCLECGGGSTKSVLWCTCPTCPFWTRRFGCRPESVAKELVDKKLHQSIIYTDEDDLPNGMDQAVKYLKELNHVKV